MTNMFCVFSDAHRQEYSSIMASYFAPWSRMDSTATLSSSQNNNNGNKQSISKKERYALAVKRTNRSLRRVNGNCNGTMNML